MTNSIRIDTVDREEIRFRCSFDRPPLKDNDRHGHWAEENRIVQRIADEATVRGKAIIRAARDKGWRLPIDEHVEIVLTWAVPTTGHRNRDASGANPTLKAWIDGLTVRRGKKKGAGLLLDDNTTVVRRAVCEIVEDAPAESCGVTIRRVP